MQISQVILPHRCGCAVALAVLFELLFFVGTSLAGPQLALYGVMYNETIGVDSSYTFAAVSTVTGIATPIFNFTLPYALSAMAYDPNTGKFVVLGEVGGNPYVGKVVEIDVATHTLTEHDITGLPPSNLTNFVGIEYDPTQYGPNQTVNEHILVTYGQDENGNLQDRIAAINPSTGAVFDYTDPPLAVTDCDSIVFDPATLQLVDTDTNDDPFEAMSAIFDAIPGITLYADPGTDAELYEPACSADGTMYFSRRETQDLWKLNVTGNGYDLVGPHWTTPSDAWAVGLAFGAVPLADPLADPTGIDKIRFISFSVLDSGADTALRINLDSMHHLNPPYTGAPSVPFIACEGKDRYAGPPFVFLESQARVTPFVASQTQATPFYRNWSSFLSCSDNVAPFEYGVNFDPTTPLPVCAANADCPAGETCSVAVNPLLHVTGSAIVPSSSYTVENLSAACMGVHDLPPCQSGGENVSSGLAINTQRWGDVVDPLQLLCGPSHPNPACQNAATCTGTDCRTQPDALDFASMGGKFRSQLGAPIKARTLLAGTGVDGVIDLVPDLGFNHISADIAAFQGKAYPYTPECLANP